MKLLDDVEYFKFHGAYCIEHLRCRGEIVDLADFCDCEDCQNVSVCVSCKKKWYVPYENLVMAAKMKDFEAPIPNRPSTAKMGYMQASDCFYVGFH